MLSSFCLNALTPENNLEYLQWLKGKFLQFSYIKMKFVKIENITYLIIQHFLELINMRIVTIMI